MESYDPLFKPSVYRLYRVPTSTLSVSKDPLRTSLQSKGRTLFYSSEEGEHGS